MKPDDNCNNFILTLAVFHSIDRSVGTYAMNLHISSQIPCCIWKLHIIHILSFECLYTYKKLELLLNCTYLYYLYRIPQAELNTFKHSLWTKYPFLGASNWGQSCTVHLKWISSMFIAECLSTQSVMPDYNIEYCIANYLPFCQR